MEDKVGSPAIGRARKSWIVGPQFDLLFIANIAWPLLLLPGVSTNHDTAVDFWQVYFLTLPHRWITLFLVAVDPDRRQQRTASMVVVALVSGVLVVAAFWGFNFGPHAFVCLGFIDYVWNGWHFGSQHAGVLRIYSKKVDASWPWLDRWGLRLFAFLTILRTSSALLWPQTHGTVSALLVYSDWILVAIPIFMLASTVYSFQRSHVPRLIYLLSVSTLYGTYLMASHYHWQDMVLCMATAASLFHALEYLAIVTHYAQRRQEVGSPGAMRWLSQRWIATLACFMLTLGMLGFYLGASNSRVSELWQGLNLWAAFVHYALDGMIWKLRQPATAHSLGVT